MSCMKDSDDYITRKAANPQTGLISPSVQTSSPVSSHTRTAQDARSTCAPTAAAAPRRAFPGRHDTSKSHSKLIMDKDEGKRVFRDDKFVLRMPSAREPQPFEYPGCSSEQIQVREHSKQKTNGVLHEGHNGSHARNTLHCATYAPARDNNQLRFSSAPYSNKPFPYTDFRAHQWDAVKGEWLGDIKPKHERPRQDKETAGTWPASSQSRVMQGQTAEASVKSGHGPDELQNDSKALLRIHRRPLGAAPRPRSAGENQDADPGATEIDTRGRAFKKGCNRGGRCGLLPTAESDIRCDPAMPAEMLSRFQLPCSKAAAVLQCEPEQRGFTKQDCLLGCGRQNCNMALANRKRQSEPSLAPVENECSSQHSEMPRLNSKTVLQVTLEVIVGSALGAWDTMQQTSFPRLEASTSSHTTLQQKFDILKALSLLIGQTIAALAVFVVLSRLGQAVAQALDIMLWPLLFPFMILKWLVAALSHR